MNNSFQPPKQDNFAQDYYPKALNLDEKQSSSSAPPPPQQPSGLSSIFSSLFSGNSNSQNLAPLMQMLGGNPLLSSLFSGQKNQSDIFSNLISSFTKNDEKKDEKEKVIEIKNSIEEL